MSVRSTPLCTYKYIITKIVIDTMIEFLLEKCFALNNKEERNSWRDENNQNQKYHLRDELGDGVRYHNSAKHEVF